MKKILIFTLILFFIASTYNLVIRPIDLTFYVLDNQNSSNELVRLKIIPKNELGFQVPFLFERINYSIVEGSSLIEIEPITSTTFILLKKNDDASGRILISFEFKRTGLKKFFEFSIPNQKV